MKIINSDARIFEGWASVEVLDSQGDIIPIDEIAKVFDVYMKHGGNIMDTHSNRQVGRVIHYEIKNHEKTSQKGIYIVGQIFKDERFPTFDEVWEKIKSGEYKGLSFGGRTHLKEYRYEKGKELPIEVLRQLEAFEVSVCREPANKEAVIMAVSVAKSDDIELGCGGFKDFDACVRHMQRQGYSEESGRRICGKIKEQSEKAMKSEKELDFEKTIVCARCGKKWSDDGGGRCAYCGHRDAKAIDDTYDLKGDVMTKKKVEHEGDVKKEPEPGLPEEHNEPKDEGEILARIEEKLDKLITILAGTQKAEGKLDNQEGKQQVLPKSPSDDKEQKEEKDKIEVLEKSQIEEMINKAIEEKVKVEIVKSRRPPENRKYDDISKLATDIAKSERPYSWHEIYELQRKAKDNVL